uniref:Uncharacterized protein n=1 Tax=Anguilla anguilla TaxID=7936 RepID=A0A0E9QKK2_ANGAN
MSCKDSKPRQSKLQAKSEQWEYSIVHFPPPPERVF